MELTDLKKIITLLALGATLSGCAATGGTTGTTTGVSTTQLIAYAQQAASVLCGIAPAAASITSIFTASNPGAQVTQAEAEQAAQIFCSSVSKLSVSHKFAAVKSRGLVDFGMVTINSHVVEIQGRRL